MIPCDNKTEEVLFWHLFKYHNNVSRKDEHIVTPVYLNHDISTDQTSVVLKLKMANINLVYLMWHMMTRPRRILNGAG